MPGTLLLPEPENRNVKTLYIFIHGSGPHDRDETIYENKPFKDMAEGLLKYGISSFRFDKRTKIAPHLFSNDQYTIDDEVTFDILNIINFFKSNDAFKDYKLVLIGHSLGGMMIPKIIMEAGDKVDAAIMLAANSRALSELILEQFEYLYTLNPSKEMEHELEKIKKQIHYLHSPAFDLNTSKENLPLNLPASYWKSLLDYDQVLTAQKIDIPLYIIQGERDYQVTMRDFELWKSSLKDKPNVDFKSFPKLNHLLMEGRGKSTPEEYTIKNKVPEYLIKDVVEWIHKIFSF